MAVEVLTEEQQMRLLRFQHPEKVLARYGGPTISDEQAAAVLGVEIAFFRRVRHGSAELVAEAARAILADPALASAVDRLPFEPGATVVGLGDSITDDEQSWLE